MLIFESHLERQEAIVIYLLDTDTGSSSLGSIFYTRTLVLARAILKCSL